MTSYAVPPSAARLTSSLRDVGYDFHSAIADLVDNSIAAGASQVDVEIVFDGEESYVTIADNGGGMSANGVQEALRFGSRRDYAQGDLGRYGLGLKTASLSHARAVTVVTRSAAGVVTARTLDLDLIAEWDEWLIVDPGATTPVSRAKRKLEKGRSTCVIWERLDRALPERNPEGGWARRRLQSLADRTAEHLSMVFHRFLIDPKRLRLEVNGRRLDPWDPYAQSEKRTRELTPMTFEAETPDGHVGTVHLDRYILPSREQFSSLGEFERMSGPLKWNRQQGLYIYRANRLVQWGGWAGTRALDEHTKLARAALRFDTDLDVLFNTNVAKMRVSLPGNVKQPITPALTELAQAAGHEYRRANRMRTAEPGTGAPAGIDRESLLALRVAALAAGEKEALDRIFAKLRRDNPQLAQAMGLDF
ncbi:ATP-binding protein [Serinicoccus sp. CNJ-927]|uniref:ATP-binding protein n=1 Tax=Serinicoccus sp. CNJ-927 TaxID=1904970 RepID=UPI0009675864|nr:ATP-binding protein [Serinicoccus sp. CNJ-927]OLT39246.1 ATP-binding protein [Serinicoccus sp. CNJ-927]